MYVTTQKFMASHICTYVAMQLQLINVWILSYKLIMIIACSTQRRLWQDTDSHRLLVVPELYMS